MHSNKALIAALLCSAAFTATAQENVSDSQRDAQNPFADITAFQLDYYHIENFKGLGDGKANIVALRYYDHWDLGDWGKLGGFGDETLITRAVAPYFLDTPGGKSGFGDMTASAGFAFEKSWGTYGYGIQSTLPTGTNGLSNDRLLLGPIMGAIAFSGPWTAGLVSYNQFKVAGENSASGYKVSTLQPLLHYNLNRGLSIGASEMFVEYDWDRDEFTSLPLGIGISQMLPVKNWVLQGKLSYEHDFFDGIGGETDTVMFTLLMIKRRDTQTGQ
jgi:hypothetical protein